MKYRIGLDTGIASVGWSVIEHDHNDQPCRIVDLGVRTFDPAENPKDGSSLNVDRRDARGLRRRLRRLTERTVLAKKYLTQNLLNGASDTNINRDVFELRAKALGSKISKQELYTVVTYLIKHRGFKSNRKSELADKEASKLVKIMNNNQQAYIQNYRTLGEWIFNDDKFFTINSNGVREYKVRNHSDGGSPNYDNCFLRADVEKELSMILQNQQQYHTAITSQFVSDVLNIFNRQRGFDEGPNQPSPYKADYKVANCRFEKELCAPKGSFTFEYFNALQNVVHTKLSGVDGTMELSTEQKNIIIADILKGSKVTYKKIRKLLNLPFETTFKNLSYFMPAKKREGLSDLEVMAKCEDKKFFEFDFTKKLTKVLGLEINKSNADLIDAVGFILSMRKSDNVRTDALNGNDDICNKLSANQLSAIKTLTAEQIELILPLETAKFGSLGFTAMNKIIPFMEQGQIYNQACDSAGYDFNSGYNVATKTNKIVWENLKESLTEVTSPVVLRTISQTVKVVNAITQKYGQPSAIFLEVARDMSRNFTDRKDIEKKQKYNKENNERYVESLKQMGIIARGQDIIKYKLYEEQGGKCAYSGKSFIEVLGSVDAVFNNNSTQVDHIIPYSKCYDDSMANKVLVLSSENQLKANRLPFEYMSPQQFENFQAFVSTTYKNNFRKKENLLKRSISQEEQQSLNNRALNDTKHAARFLLNMFKANMIFADSKRFAKSPVRAVNGSMTSFMRKVWGINKVRFENDKHHAIDACVVACCTNHMINKVSRYLQFKSWGERTQNIPTEIIDGVKMYLVGNEKITQQEYDELHFPYITPPYENFQKEIDLRLNSSIKTPGIEKEYIQIGYTSEDLQNVRDVFVSRMPNRKVKGQMHLQTRYAERKCTNDKLNAVLKVELSKLKVKDGEIQGYLPENKVSDPLLYKALIDRINQFSTVNAKGEKIYDIESAFKQPLHKPTKSGSLGPIIKKVKIGEFINNPVKSKNNQLYAQSSMVRVDVFTKNNKNYFLPIYTNDVYAGKLPTKLVKANTPYAERPDVDETYQFKFSLFKNDLIRVKSTKCFNGKGVNDASQVTNPTEVYGYFNGIHSGTGNLTFYSNDRQWIFEGVGPQNLPMFKKYNVDILGTFNQVKSETRLPLKIKSK